MKKSFKDNLAASLAEKRVRWFQHRRRSSFHNIAYTWMPLIKNSSNDSRVDKKRSTSGGPIHGQKRVPYGSPYQTYEVTYGRKTDEMVPNTTAIAVAVDVCMCIAASNNMVPNSSVNKQAHSPVANESINPP